MRRSLLAAAALSALLTHATPARAGGDWNDAAIAWRTHDGGLAEAKRTGKPVCLVFFTQWCPHCTRYGRVFHDPAVVARAQRFVMIRVDRDANRALSARYDVDGQYIPRTYFLSSKGELERTIHAPRQRYKYFFDEDDPRDLLRGMDAALKRFGGGG